MPPKWWGKELFGEYFVCLHVDEIACKKALPVSSFPSTHLSESNLPTTLSSSKPHHYRLNISYIVNELKGQVNFFFFCKV